MEELKPYRLIGHENLSLSHWFWDYFWFQVKWKKTKIIQFQYIVRKYKFQSVSSQWRRGEGSKWHSRLWCFLEMESWNLSPVDIHQISPTRHHPCDSLYKIPVSCKWVQVGFSGCLGSSKRTFALAWGSLHTWCWENPKSSQHSNTGAHSVMWARVL